MITPAEVVAEVQRIISQGNDDPETSHHAEDRLAVKILTAIAEGAPDGQALASAFLPILDADLLRWYA